MNLREASFSLRSVAFRMTRAAVGILPGGRITAFGAGGDSISSILIINLDRQPQRWRRMQRELRRFQTSDGAPLISIARRFAAVDARDGREVAATADVDSTYRVGDHLYVQPDARLAECFGADEPIRMTRQEIAVARSHVEIWKTIVTGRDDYVLVLEDDVWFRRGAAAAIDRGWRAVLQRSREEGGPRLVYFSYADAGGTAERVDLCDALFRPVRGLWFLSGYVLSRKGAEQLLRAMPVVGPVDLWINYRFRELGALALSSPALLQRQDAASDNSYSVLPYLARAGIVDAGSGPMPPDRSRTGPVLVWTAESDLEALPMALSMLGLRVRVFDSHDDVIDSRSLTKLFEMFDALVDAHLTPSALSAASKSASARFLLEHNAASRFRIDIDDLPSSRMAIMSPGSSAVGSWRPLCTLLDLAKPIESFPVGARRSLRVFRDGRDKSMGKLPSSFRRRGCQLDDSPWILPPRSGWQSRPTTSQLLPASGERLLHATMTTETRSFVSLVETFPGNLASFRSEGVSYDRNGLHLVIDKAPDRNRPYRSGAVGSNRSFNHGRFEASIKAAPGSGLVTGFFLHRGAPRQEIDIELSGDDPRYLLVNVYFNPGDDGAAMAFGYRGSPCRIDLGFDTTVDFHVYAIDWQPERIAWLVDGKVVHERASWDPTPIPHLPMRLHANLWVPRSEELAGGIDDSALPATAVFRDISVWA